jgi:hypothetical protein
MRRGIFRRHAVRQARPGTAQAAARAMWRCSPPAVHVRIDARCRSSRAAAAIGLDRPCGEQRMIDATQPQADHQNHRQFHCDAECPRPTSRAPAEPSSHRLPSTTMRDRHRSAIERMSQRRPHEITTPSCAAARCGDSASLIANGLIIRTAARPLLAACSASASSLRRPCGVAGAAAGHRLHAARV